MPWLVRRWITFRSHQRWGLIVVLLLGVLSCLSFGQSLQAQEEGEPVMPSKPEMQPMEEGVEKPGKAAPATSPDDVASNEPEPVAGNQRSYLKWMIDASGFFGALILVCSFVMVALIVMNLLELRRDNFLPASFLEAFEALLDEKNYQAAYDTAKADDSLVARVLAAGMAQLNTNYDQAVEAMQTVGDDENQLLEHRLSYLGLIGQLAPMLGLLGTVQGMIASFQVIANSATAPKPSELADGIATALFTTLEGLCVAIPAITAFLFIRNRIARLMFEVANVSDALMKRFSDTGKS